MNRRRHAGRGVSRASLVGPVLLGIGLGGFVDGILFHQVFQWHHMLTDHPCCPATTVPGLEENTVADGLFHVATWLAVVGGLASTVTASRRGEPAPPRRRYLGLALAGWGLFNLVEGVVDHHILGVHHVRDDLGAPIGWDIAFLALGAGLLAVGGWLATSSREPPNAG